MYADHPLTNDDKCDCVMSYNMGGFGLKNGRCRKCLAKILPTVIKMKKRFDREQELKNTKIGIKNR